MGACAAGCGHLEFDLGGTERMARGMTFDEGSSSWRVPAGSRCLEPRDA